MDHPPAAACALHASLDATVDALCEALTARGVEAPDVLFLLATGCELLPDHLRHGREVPLGELPGVPAPWDGTLLHAGRLGELSAWALEDVHGDPTARGGPAWVAGLPVWLAAASGATVCVHASAGSALVDDEGPRAPVGGFAILRDHVNLGGPSPLTGLGPSKLGPLFPDQSHLHHAGLRAAAVEHARALGHAAGEAVAVCTHGPAIETPAERAMMARLGGDVAVQSLAAPLVACAHAGLACLALVVVTDDGGSPTDLAYLVDQAADASPALDELLCALAPDLASTARLLAEGDEA